LEPWNNLFLIAIMIWLQTGFAMVILSSAVKGVPGSLLEAARIDGAGELRIFFQVIIPYVSGTIFDRHHDDRHPGTQNIRCGVRHDQRSVQYRRDRQHDVQPDVQARPIWPRCGSGGDYFHRRLTGDDPEYPEHEQGLGGEDVEYNSQWKTPILRA
jgi:hypothetical protein